MKVKNNLLTALSSLKENMAITRPSIANQKILNAIEIAVARCADRQDDTSIDEKYVHEILFLVSNTPGSITFLSRRITIRLEAAEAPIVVLKTLVLLHRLLRGGDRYFEQDLRNLWASRELRLDLLWCSADKGHLHSFLSKYSLFLEERMGWIINQAGMLEPSRPAGPEPRSSEEGVDWLLYRLLKCQSFLDKIMDCSQGNMSSSSQVMQSACNIMLRESIRVYESFCDGIEIMVSSFFEFTKSPRTSALEILKEACIQTPKLYNFYENCKRSNAGKSLDYPLVRIIMSSEVSEMEDSLPSGHNHNQRHSGWKPGEGEGVHHVESTPFSEKFETTISTVWVEFDEEDSILL